MINNNVIKLPYFLATTFYPFGAKVQKLWIHHCDYITLKNKISDEFGNFNIYLSPKW